MDKIRVSKYFLMATINGIKASDQQKIESLQNTISDLNMEMITAFEDKQFPSKKKGADLLRDVHSVLSVASDNANDLDIVGSHLCQWLVKVIDDLHLPKPFAQQVKEMAQTLATRFGTPEDVQKKRAEAASSPDDVKDLKALVSTLVAQVESLRSDVKQLTEKNVELTNEVSELKANTAKLEEKNTALTNKVSELEGKNTELTNEVAKLRKDIEKRDKRFNEVFNAQTLRNFWQYYLRVILVGAQIVKSEEEIQNSSTGQLLKLLTEEKEKYETWAKKKDSTSLQDSKDPKLLSFNEIVTYATSVVNEGNKVVHNSHVNEMFQTLVLSDENMHAIYMPMWNYLAKVKKWKTWAEMEPVEPSN